MHQDAYTFPQFESCPYYLVLTILTILLAFLEGSTCSGQFMIKDAFNPCALITQLCFAFTNRADLTFAQLLRLLCALFLKTTLTASAEVFWIVGFAREIVDDSACALGNDDTAAFLQVDVNAERTRGSDLGSAGRLYQRAHSLLVGTSINYVHEKTGWPIPSRITQELHSRLFHHSFECHFCSSFDGLIDQSSFEPTD